MAKESGHGAALAQPWENWLTGASQVVKHESDEEQLNIQIPNRYYIVGCLEEPLSIHCQI